VKPACLIRFMFKLQKEEPGGVISLSALHKLALSFFPLSLLELFGPPLNRGLFRYFSL
jgi:hypothetical protein